MTNCAANRRICSINRVRTVALSARRCSTSCCWWRRRRRTRPPRSSPPHLPTPDPPQPLMAIGVAPIAAGGGGEESWLSKPRSHPRQARKADKSRQNRRRDRAVARSDPNRCCAGDGAISSNPDWILCSADPSAKAKGAVHLLGREKRSLEVLSPCGFRSPQDRERSADEGRVKGKLATCGWAGVYWASGKSEEVEKYRLNDA